MAMGGGVMPGVAVVAKRKKNKIIVKARGWSFFYIVNALGQNLAKSVISGNFVKKWLCLSNSLTQNKVWPLTRLILI